MVVSSDAKTNLDLSSVIACEDAVQIGDVSLVMSCVMDLLM